MSVCDLSLKGHIGNSRRNRLFPDSTGLGVQTLKSSTNQRTLMETMLLRQIFMVWV
ncbi:MAG: hypothetical protein LBL62_10585 [Planctomycetaceae bacterium]|nr:hypothetical protein [Planctomycetaceae bacterium]